MTRQEKMSNFEFRRANIAEQVVSCLMRKLLISIIFCTKSAETKAKKSNKHCEIFEQNKKSSILS